MRWFVLLVFLFFAGAEAASFNCTKVEHSVEKLICDDSLLSSLDEQLARAYASSLNRMPDQQERLIVEQRHWLQGRNQCSSLNCVRLSYESRIKILEGTPKYTTHESDIAFDCIEALEELINYKPNRDGERILDYDQTLEMFEQLCPRYGFRIPLTGENIELNRANANELDKQLTADGYTGPSFSRTYSASGREPRLFYNAP